MGMEVVVGQCNCPCHLNPIQHALWGKRSISSWVLSYSVFHGRGGCIIYTYTLVREKWWLCYRNAHIFMGCWVNWHTESNNHKGRHSLALHTPCIQLWEAWHKVSPILVPLAHLLSWSENLAICAVLHAEWGHFTRQGAFVRPELSKQD